MLYIGIHYENHQHLKCVCAHEISTYMKKSTYIFMYVYRMHIRIHAEVTQLRFILSNRSAIMCGFIRNIRTFICLCI